MDGDGIFATELDALVKRVQETGAASHSNPNTDDGLRLELLQRRMIVGP